MLTIKLDGGGEDCGTSALMAGASVREAELRTEGGDAVFEKVELG